MLRVFLNCCIHRLLRWSLTKPGALTPVDWPARDPSASASSAPASVSDFYIYIYRCCQFKLGPHTCTVNTLLVEPCFHPQIHILNSHTLYLSASLIIMAEFIPHSINSSCFELKPFLCPSIHSHIHSRL